MKNTLKKKVYAHIVRGIILTLMASKNTAIIKNDIII